MVCELPAFLYWIINEYEVPESMRHVRYNVVYRNPEVEPELAAPSVLDQDRENQEIVSLALGATIVNARELSAGKLFDEIFRYDSPVKERARHNEHFLTPRALLKTLRNWVSRYGGSAKDSWVIFDEFKMQQVYYDTNRAYKFKFKSM
jgi:hypothetical protein